MGLLKKYFGCGCSAAKNLTAEEKELAEAKKRFEIVSAILKIEESQGLKAGSEEWYCRLVDLCAEHNAYFVIPCSEDGPC